LASAGHAANKLVTTNFLLLLGAGRVEAQETVSYLSNVAEGSRAGFVRNDLGV